MHYAGDSGRGLQIALNNQTTLVGLVSFGAEAGCQKDYPTVLTFLPPFLDWIHSKIANSDKIL